MHFKKEHLNGPLLDDLIGPSVQYYLFKKIKYNY